MIFSVENKDRYIFGKKIMICFIFTLLIRYMNKAWMTVQEMIKIHIKVIIFGRLRNRPIPAFYPKLWEIYYNFIMQWLINDRLTTLFFFTFNKSRSDYKYVCIIRHYHIDLIKNNNKIFWEHIFFDKNLLNCLKKIVFTLVLLYFHLFRIQ